MMLGDFDFEGLRTVNPILGPVLFSFFAMLVVFVLLNMFIAIISDSFDETKKALAAEQDIGLKTLGSSVIEYLITDILFKLPLLGPLIKTYFQQIDMVRLKTVKLLSKMKNGRFIVSVLLISAESVNCFKIL